VINTKNGWQRTPALDAQDRDARRGEAQPGIEVSRYESLQRGGIQQLSLGRTRHNQHVVTEREQHTYFGNDASFL
jgi:hypothetical protein